MLNKQFMEVQGALQAAKTGRGAGACAQTLCMMTATVVTPDVGSFTWIGCVGLCDVADRYTAKGSTKHCVDARRQQGCQGTLPSNGS